MCLQATPVGPPAKSSSITCSLRQMLPRTTQGKVNLYKQNNWKGIEPRQTEAEIWLISYKNDL